ncbi:MAG: hypothetical protein AAF571_05850 [Verrucomicrobiota bacterium]
MPKSNAIQKSNFGKNSFILTNTGEKDIVSFQLDVTKALFPDTVFDPEGIAGDSVAKPLQINRNDTTGVVHHPGKKAPHYVGAGGTLGFELLKIKFNPATENGFNPGEVLGFSIDMDPNSIAGTNKKPLDEGTVPKWDVGGVSGAELIGSSFEVTFSDGTKASGILFSTSTQAGCHGIATEQPAPSAPFSLSANGTAPGEKGTYSIGGPKIQIKGGLGLIVRVVVAKGFIQPVQPYDEPLKALLDQLAEQPFPANNAVEFQFADITLTGEEMDISAQFDFSGVKQYDFQVTDMPFSIDEDKVPLGITAAVINPGNKDLPASLSTAPIYLTFE